MRYINLTLTLTLTLTTVVPAAAAALASSPCCHARVILRYREQFDAKLQIEVLAQFMTEQAQTQCLKVS